MVFNFVTLVLFLILLCHPLLGVVSEHSRYNSSVRWLSSRNIKPHSFGLPRKKPSKSSWIRAKIRGGDAEDEEQQQDEDGDEERYSRQVYTLGARAHGLIRTATVYIDGPAKSGLVYECAKNLALTGIGKIVILSSNDEHDTAYHRDELDDLGTSYTNGARAEVEDEDKTCTSDEELLREYIHRLNPSLDVQATSRKELNNEEMMNSEKKQGILLCVDRPYDTQVRMNQLCRRLGFPFVAAETAGVYGLIFSDFGPSFHVHDVDGETPLVVPLDRIEVSEDREEKSIVLVRCVSGERHDVSRGDEIKFQLSSGDNLEVPCTVEKVKSPELILVRPTLDNELTMNEFVERVNSEASTFTRMKQIEEISFVTLEEAVANAMDDTSLFVPSDLDKSFDDIRRDAIFSSFHALSQFVKENKRLPAGTTDDGDAFLSLAKRSWNTNDNSKETKAWEKHCKTFARINRAKFVPQQAMFGAIASQECLKAASGLYNPIRQFLLYDCDEILPAKLAAQEESTSSGLSCIFGEKIVQDFHSKNIFVVGAGAIGCEILKNLAAMGAATSENGRILVTDMDTIEQSNLSRQLLFRDGDIGKFKSQAAQDAVKRLNASVEVECHVSKVGDEEHGPFDFQFWSKRVDVVLNALDNMEARLFIDSQCVANKLGLVDAGTLGSKGNVQVVVPHETESYGSSADPPEPSIPVCTLKNFPYAISHTIQWGRDLFEGYFARRPKKTNGFLESTDSTGIESLISKIKSDIGEQEALEAARELREDINVIESKRNGSLRSECINWAIGMADDLFHDKIVELLAKYPIDSLDEDNEPFWSGSRKAPTPLSFSFDSSPDGQQELVNQNYVDFVRNAARLRIETVLGEEADSLISEDEAISALRSAKEGKSISALERRDSVHEILKDITSLDSNDETLHMAEFEKDDESNGHVAFITAASNLRAICYGIPPVDAMETRKVAGNIVPAMVTTTAFVSALSCIELFKLVQNSKLGKYRNSFVNLALPFFASTVPLPAEEIEGLRGQTFTLWDRIVVKESKKAAAAGGITLKQLLKRLRKEIGQDEEEVEISSVSYGPYLIYASFLHEDEPEHLQKNLWDLITESVDAGMEFDSEFSRESGSENGSTGFQIQPVIELSVAAEDLKTGEEVALPPVRVVRRDGHKSS